MAKWQDPEIFAIWLGVVILVLIILIIAFIYFTRMYFSKLFEEQERVNKLKLNHREALLRDSILIQERERNRIAADIHDAVISKMNILQLSIYSNTSQENVLEMLKRIINDTRRISHDLAPPLLNETSLIELIEEFTGPLKNVYKVSFNVSDHDRKRLPNDVKLQIFRIVQEVIGNIIKHAEAKSISILLRWTPQYLCCSIKDDGIGFIPDDNKGGLGMKNVQLRIRLLKGKMKLDAVPDRGTRILFLIPNTTH